MKKCLKKCWRCQAGRERLSRHCSSDVWYFFSILRQNNRSKNIDTSLGLTKAWDLKAPPISQKNTKKIHFFSEFQTSFVSFKCIFWKALFSKKCTLLWYLQTVQEHLSPFGRGITRAWVGILGSLGVFSERGRFEVFFEVSWTHLSLWEGSQNSC